jgi:hypothetical protein
MEVVFHRTSELPEELKITFIRTGKMRKATCMGSVPDNILLGSVVLPGGIRAWRDPWDLKFGRGVVARRTVSVLVLV